MRRSHDSVLAVNSIECPNCGELKLSHHICKSCGFYNKREVVKKIETDSEKNEDSEN